ncbi:threonine/serine exporter family protein [Ornithinimicrobium sediminis]|uniref:threonine/serine ThrE exporter family protein n=1 Tax=Ornithinimicrobium sediminis TaxID=2904603 RepID=UPI001E4B5F9F|nr:threonine/serine exporter family protein [Ornithinimicrobium sediminis]
MTQQPPRHDAALPGRTEITGPMVRPATNVGRVWRAKAQWAVRGLGPPTVPLALPGSDDDLSQRHARSVIDLALRIGEALLSTGASAADVVTTVLRLTYAYGVRSAHVDITYTSISVSIQRGVDEDPLAVMRVIKTRSPDYSRLEQIQLLVDDVAGRARRGEEMRPVEEARQDLGDILSAPHPYRRWVVTMGQVLIAVGVVVLFGGGPGMWVVAGLSAAIVDRVQRLLHSAGVAAFFSQAVSAGIPTTIAVLLFTLDDVGLSVPGVDSPSLVVISGIIVLLAGLGVMGAAQDAVDGYYVTAGARGLEVVMMTLGIAIGISAVLATANRLGVPMEIAPFIALGGSPVLGTIGATVVAIGFSLSSYSGPRATAVAAALGAVAWVALELVSVLGVGTTATVTAAATVVGVLGHTVYRVLRVPELAITTAAIVSLLPGLAVYRGLFYIMSDSPQLVTAAAMEFVTAASTGLGLAAGLSLGAYAARRRFGLDRASIRARRRSVGAYRS